MIENKHGFVPKQEIEIGGIAFTIIQTGVDWVKCIASKCVEKRAFDKDNKNNFSVSSLRHYLNGEFLQRLIKAGAPEEMFEYFDIDLTADDGLKKYGADRARVGLITCEEYRSLRDNIPPLSEEWWWTATPDSPINSFVRNVNKVGSLNYNGAYYGYRGVRPLCNLKSEILKSYLAGDSDAETVRHGTWLKCEVYRKMGVFNGLMCSECAYEKITRSSWYNYCPNCGAKMQLEGDEVMEE